MCPNYSALKFNSKRSRRITKTNTWYKNIQSSQKMRKEMSMWIILSTYLQDDVKHVLTMKPVAENKLVQIRWKQSVRRAKLASQFPFGAHPHTFNVLSVYVSISRINKMSDAQ